MAYFYYPIKFVPSNIHHGTLPGPVNRIYGFGATTYDPVSVGIKGAQLLASSGAAIASSGGAGTAGVIGIEGTSIGISTLALGVVGLALAVVGVVYSLVTAHDAKKKAERRQKESEALETLKLGESLIAKVYMGEGVPGWENIAYYGFGFGKYYALGQLFTNWSNARGGERLENTRKALVNFLKVNGLEPTRFVGSNNVKPGESINYSTEFVANPEKSATAREALIALGYLQSAIERLTPTYLQRIFDVIMAIPKAKSDAQAKLILEDLQSAISATGLNPGQALDPIIAQASKNLPVTPIGATTAAETMKAGFSPLVILFIGGLALALLGGRGKWTKGTERTESMA